MQRGAVFLETAIVSLEFPVPDTEVIPGVRWGAIDAFPSPAYWAYQVLARRIQGDQINYKLGSTLKEEVGACLLGGHGIPASVGLEAFQHLKRKGAFDGEPPSEGVLFAWLSEPISSGSRMIHYRFARQKAKYLATALLKLSLELPPLDSGKALRDWLLGFPGIGYKTASWIARNWLDADDIAILDIHILRAGQLGGFFEQTLTVERHYLQLEQRFLQLSRGLGVRASELDALIWLDMMSSAATVHGLLDQRTSASQSGVKVRATEQRQSNPKQLILIG